MNILNPRAKADRTEHWRAFDKAWFARHQALLLFGLNTPGLATAIRGLLRISMRDVWCPRRTAIVEIAPNHYTVQLHDGQLRTDFRSHDKYSKRLYYAWKPLWWLLHGWDAAFADRWVPSLSYGFSTLTAYPDPNPETATVDGYVQRFQTSVTWADIRDGVGTDADDIGTQITVPRVFASTTTNEWQLLVRGITLFDTSTLTADAIISAAVLSVYGNAKSDGLAITPDLDVYTSTPASNTALAAADYAQIATTSQTGAPITYAGFSTVGYNDFTFSATGRGNVSKTGVSKFAIRNANYDVANVAPAWTSGALSQFRFYVADQAATTQDPKLVVTYTLPGGGGSPVPSGLRGLSVFRSKGRR